MHDVRQTEAKIARKGLSKSAIAKQLNIGRTSVRRLLANA
jgi:DNA-binding transcriptional regulator LsrR (DeoR family)